MRNHAVSSTYHHGESGSVEAELIGWEALNASVLVVGAALRGVVKKETAMFASGVRGGNLSGVRRWRRCAAVVTIGLAGLGTTGCDNAGEGALSGAALGALGGMAIGSLTGDMGKGAVVGAVLGGLGGLLVGDQNERNDRRSGR